MSLSKKTVDFLLDVNEHFSSQFDELAQNCQNEVERALNEIIQTHIQNKLAYVVPYGVYTLKTNYQLVEPMEFFVVLPSNKESVTKIEDIQKKQMQKTKRQSVKDIYQSIALSNKTDENGNTINLTAFDTAKTIMSQLQKYLNLEDKVYYKRNVVFLKLHIDEEIDLPVIIYVGYQFEDNFVEFSKLGYKTKEDIKQTINNILIKNNQTNGKYLVLCKLFKMLELELVINEESNVYLSKKSLFVESILYNVPNTIFDCDDFSKIFSDIVIFLKQSSVNELYTVDSSSQNLFTKNGYYSNKYYASFVKKIEYINDYANEMIDNAIKQAENANKDESVTKTQNQSEKIIKIKKSWYYSKKQPYHFVKAVFCEMISKAFMY